MQWLILMHHNIHDYILYGLTFASAIEKQPLAQEDIQKQLNNDLKLGKQKLRTHKITKWIKTLFCG